MGGLWELAAFVFRALQTHNQASENWDTLYTLFFLLAPICEIMLSLFEITLTN